MAYDRGLHRVMSEAVYADHEAWEFYKKPVYATVAFFIAAGARLYQEIIKIIAEPDTKERLAALGLEPVGDSPEQFSAQLKVEMEKWTRIIRVAKIRAE